MQRWGGLPPWPCPLLHDTQGKLFLAGSAPIATRPEGGAQLLCCLWQCVNQIQWTSGGHPALLPDTFTGFKVCSKWCICWDHTWWNLVFFFQLSLKICKMIVGKLLTFAISICAVPCKSTPVHCPKILQGNLCGQQTFNRWIQLSFQKFQSTIDTF